MKAPSVGDIFALDVTPEVVVALRVVASRDVSCCVVMTQWSGRPSKGLPRSALLFEVQPLSHHAWKRPVLGGWVSGAVPDALRHLGRAALKKAEAARVAHPEDWVKPGPKPIGLKDKVLPVFPWDELLRHVRTQWQWDHRREELLKEDAAKAREGLRSLANAVDARRREVASLEKKGLSALHGQVFFAPWVGDRPQALVEAAEAAVQGAVKALNGLPPSKARLRLLSLVRAFNRLNGMAGHDFDASDTEDVLEVLNMLAGLCGVADDAFDDAVDAVRTF